MKVFFALIITIVFAISCKKDSKNFICFTGKVQWSGSQTVDGLEWQILDTINNISFKVIDPDSSYRQHNLIVQVCLSKTEETYPCFCASPVYIYNINSINR